jgi:hypothetical protein
MEQIDDGESSGEPLELGSGVGERAAAINASDTGVPVKEPVQSGIQRGGIKHSGGARQRKMTTKLRNRMWCEEGVGQSSVAQRSGGS